MSAAGDVNQRQDDLTTVVEPLVDSVSELVLAAVTKQFGNVQGLCQDISDRTTTLVTVAQQVALSSTDYDVQMEVAASIDEIASTIESLVVSFTALLQNSNPQTQESFAVSAKGVGDAINRVCQSTDQTSERKLQRAVQECIQSTKGVVDAARLGIDKLLAAAQINVERTVKLVKIAAGAAAATADDTKKRELTEAGNAVKMGGPGLIGAAKRFAEGGKHNTSAESDLQRQQAELTRAYERLLAAASMGARRFDKAAQMLEYIRQLIASAQDLASAATQLMEIASSGTLEQFMDVAKLTAGKALEMVRAAEAAAAAEKDPVKKQLILSAAQELREAAQAYIAACKAYRENPTAANKAAMEAAHERLQAAIQRVIAATKGEFGDASTAAGKLAMSSAALEGAARTIVLDARRNPGAVNEDAAILVGVAQAVAADLERMAAETSDPAKKRRLLADAAAIRAGAQALADAAKHAAANPNDAAAQAAMDKAHQDLLSVLETARKHAGLIPGDDSDDEGPNEEAQMIQLRMAKGKEAQALAEAAKQQAAMALRLADEADALASKIADPAKRAQLQAAIKQIRTDAARVIDAANRVEANPMDTKAQADLEQAQKDLGQSIHKMVVVSGAHSDADVAAALRDMLSAEGAEGSATAIFKAAEDLLDSISLHLLDTTNMDPKDVLAYAKELSLQAQVLVKQLRAMAAQTSDPIFKQKLLDAANLISDNAVQVKMLAMVRAAATGPDKANTVGNAARLIQTNIQDVIREVRAEQLRTRFKNTVRQTMAINRVMKAWKGKANV